MRRVLLMEDRLLVLRCKLGGTDALRRIYEKYRDDLLMVGIGLLNDPAAAEDIVHDVFVSFVESLGTFRLTGSLRGYLATCVANRARNFRRSAGRNTVGLDRVEAVISDCDDPARRIVCNEQLRQLSGALSQIPAEQCEVIVLHFYGQMRLRAIARMQGLSVNTIKSRYRYGINKLRSLLNGEVEK